MAALTSTNISPLPPAAQYTLTEAMDRFTQWRQLKRGYDLELGDLAWQKAQVTQGRKRQAQRRSEYLNLVASDPRRLAQGIELMASRISLELASLQNKRNEARLKSIGDQVQGQEGELTTISLRLVPSSSAHALWEKGREAQSRADALREKAIEQSYGVSSEQPVDAAALKYRPLGNAHIEIQASVFALAAKRYPMMAALEGLFIAQPRDQKIEPQTDIPSLGEAVKQFQDFAEQIKLQESFWRSLGSQTRKFVDAQTNDEASEGVALDARYQRLRKQTEVNDRGLRELDLERDKGIFVVQMAQAKLKDDAGWLDRGLLAMDSGLEQSWARLKQWLNASLIEINDVPLTSMGLLRVIFIIFIAWLISRVLRRALDTLRAHNQALSPSAIYTLGRIIHYIVLVLGIIIGLSSIGLDFTKFALFASALGVGIGFGLQNLIGNFVSGLIILFERSLKVGDFVELSSGLAGEVREINMRSTLITTNDNIEITVPNSDFVNSQVTNWTLREANRRIHVPFAVAYGTDKDIVKKAALEAAEEVKWILKHGKNRQPQVWFIQFGDSSLNFELVVWLKPEAVKRPSGVQADYLWEIDTKLKKFGIEIPFPQRDLHLRSVFGVKDGAGLSLLTRNTEVIP